MPLLAEYNGVIPMKWPLLTSVGMAWAWSQIAWTIIVNALAKSHPQKMNIQDIIGSAATLKFHTHDVYSTGGVLVTISALLALFFTLFLAEFIIPATRAHAVKFLRVHALIIYFLSAWLFATLVPFTYYVARHSIGVTAFINGVQVPQSVVDQVQKDLGTTLRYNGLGYLKIVAVLPWLTLLFILIAATVMFIAPSANTKPLVPVTSRATETTAVGHGVTTQSKPPTIPAPIINNGQSSTSPA